MKGKKIACCAGLTVLSTLLFSCSYKAASSGGIGWYAASRSQNMNEMLADVALSEKLAEKEEFDPRNFDHIAVKGKEFPANERPNVNLVFLVDVSGSMEPANRLPLVIESLKMLVEELNGADKVAICVYAGAAGTVLVPTSIDNKKDILAALNKLKSGSSTAGGQGSAIP